MRDIVVNETDIEENVVTDKTNIEESVKVRVVSIAKRML